MAKRAKLKEEALDPENHGNDETTIAMLRKDLERAQKDLERTQKDLERAQKDVELLASERQMGLGHLRRYHEMLENNEACVCCEGCGEFWDESSLGVGDNPALCPCCKVFCCSHCLPNFGCDCEKKP